MTSDYRIRLENFEGPLDLLLFLIRRAEVDVHDVPVATITDQYLESLAHIERIDVDQAGEFLVMAATLMEIKSRLIARKGAGDDASDAEERPETDEEDPRSDLIRQLLEYKRYRDAADMLESRRLEWERRFPAARAGVDRHALPTPSPEEMLELDDLNLGQIVEAFARVIATVNFDRLGEHAVVEDDTPTEVHAADMLDLLARDGSPDNQGRASLPLRGVLEGRSRSDMIGLFLALLELVRQQRVAVHQDDEGDSIILALLPEPAPDASDESHAS